MLPSADGSLVREPSRTIVHGDALAWLTATAASADTSVITSLPDVSEIPSLGFDEWRAWFIAAARAVIRWVPEEGAAIFYQSDIRHRGAWIDKGYLVSRAAEDEGVRLVWHKIVCRKPAGTVSQGRATYSHMLCFSRKGDVAPRCGSPDVLASAGTMTWTRAMGVHACELACRYLKDETNTRVVVDPFCGKGTELAVANAAGFDAVGVDLSASRCRAAAKLRLA